MLVRNLQQTPAAERAAGGGGRLNRRIRGPSLRPDKSLGPFSAFLGKALLEGRTILAGTWISRTAEYRNRNRPADAEKEEVASTHEIPLAQLPCWRHLTYGDYCKEVQRLIREIEDEAALERKLSLELAEIH